jgi:hypothetical protein
MAYNGLWALECSNSKQPWHWDSLALAMAVLNIQQQTIGQCDYPLSLFFHFLNISLDRVTCATAANV